MVELLGLLEHVLAEDAVVEAGAAIELTWWKQPAPIASASSTAFRVPSMLAVSWLAASAARS
jgi:hypothetical protein